MPDPTAKEIAEVLLGLRKKLIRIVAIIAGVWAISFTFVTDALITKIKNDLLPPGAHIVYLYPLEPLILKLKISLYLGIAVAMPYIVKVIYDTLRSRTELLDNLNISRSKAVLYLIVATILFGLGIAYGYCIMLPIFLKFLYQLAVQQGASANYSIAEFVSFVVLMLVVFGFVFELPLILYILVSNGVVKYSTLTYYRRHFYVGFFVIGAVITPPDVFTQLMVAVPMVVFFEISLLTIKVLLKGKIYEDMHSASG
ncbi:twin-arginine translocase subunit TatC [Archaeoglobus profundus]|uniref:Sec-independent protein translocase protein TatC n=1 Tax=Archaeoglobus profundus (strain DSM 5631 / JCM 9629 / NBRC 100127 / Av18) TaxID=572546 RepID=D2RD87_ARCPA|nr:twin-arginine translocase subunit TatC [Archaeoglobus profundus]ADB58081.1 Sec-independent periplasmic protein translocase [Archaeoglobus profundus DSM 5631]